MSCGKVDPKCRRCRLSEGRTQVVPGVGPCSGRIVFVGEAPGKDEDARGEPFVGRAGRILDQALSEAGVSRSQVRITNLVKCRPPGNRRPRRDEIATCTAMYLEKELQEISPKVVCALGQTVAEHFLGKRNGMADLVGKEFETQIGGITTKLVVAYHPAACLYQRKNLDKFRESVGCALSAAGLV